MKNWVIIKHTSGAIEVWRDYGTAWGSPVYTVLGYVAGSHRDALKGARLYRNGKAEGGGA